MNKLELLKMRLGITSSVRDDYLAFLLDATEKELAEMQEIKLDLSNLNHLSFLVDYAEFKYNNAGRPYGLPRHLKWRLNNLMIAKVRDKK